MSRIVLSILLALFTAHTQAEPDTDELLRNFLGSSGCLEKESLTVDDVQDYIMRGDLSAAESNPQLKCLDACLYAHTGFMDSCNVRDDKFANNKLMEQLHDNLVKCKGSVDAGERCECAYQLSKCLKERLKVM